MFLRSGKVFFDLRIRERFIGMLANEIFFKDRFGLGGDSRFRPRFRGFFHRSLRMVHLEGSGAKLRQVADESILVIDLTMNLTDRPMISVWMI